SGGDFTAKHFRTWGASVIFFEQLLASGEGERQTLKTSLEPVAEALGNTPTMSRKSYVHPTLIEALANDPRDPLHGMKRPRARRRLSSAETALLAYLKKKPKRARRK
ncbi:MAG: DNA topoisomerase IB, partial [Sphingomonas bacterium]|nr:DNA topoisomerase IB [Sphingomonas bacterium]